LSISLPMNAETGQLISRLGLVPLPGEGGFFAPVWTSPAKMTDGRACASVIRFLITGSDFSALHRLGMDEVWHFQRGDPAELTLLDPKTGTVRSLILGPEANHESHAVVPAGTWQGARLHAGGTRGWALFGCTVAPAWEENQFELGQRAELLRAFPAHAEIITSLTR
jgi:predicted cupin superfamily sugar epimerase